MGEIDKKPNDFLLKLLDLAIKHKVADIHLKVDDIPAFRVGTGIQRLNPPNPLTKTELESILFSVVSSSQREVLEKEWELDFSYPYKGSRFRVNIGFEDKGIYSTWRLIPDKILPVNEVGFPNDSWRNIISLERGLVLITGVTGSGKSTTLASLINEINQNDARNIITLEDPIEYLHKSAKSLIHQREVNTHTKSFYHGVKWALRQDPDVILVGEIRDPETAREVLNAAETGHLVLSTEHARDSAGAIYRFLDLFKAEEKDSIRAALASNLEFVLAQQLIPYTRERNRVLAMEVMRANYAIRASIRDGKYHQIPNYMKRSDGMISMDTRLAELCQQETITKETALQFCIDQKNMNDLLGQS